MAKIGLGDVPSCWQDESLDAYRQAFDAAWDGRVALEAQTREAAGRAHDMAAVYRDVLLQAHRAWRSGPGVPTEMVEASAA